MDYTKDITYLEKAITTAFCFKNFSIRIKCPRKNSSAEYAIKEITLTDKSLRYIRTQIFSKIIFLYPNHSQDFQS